MTDIKIKTPPPRKSSAGAKLFRFALLLCFLLLAGYLIGTSSWFLRAIVVPRVGKALNANLTVGDLAVRPFSEFTCSHVTLTPANSETLLTVKNIHARYSLLAMLRGNLLVETVVLDTPVITLVEDARGTSNLTPLVSGEEKPKSKSPSKAAPRVEIKTVNLKNATIRHVKTHHNGDRITTELANVNLVLNNLRNGASGTLNVSAAVALEKVTAAPPATASLQALLNTELSFALLDDLSPGSLKGLAAFSVGRATGEFTELGGLVARLDCDVTPTEVKELALRFNKGATALGEVRVSGPFVAEKTEGQLKLEILPIDRQVLNLAGAASGIDFGTTTISGVTDIGITRNGRMIATVGQVSISRLQIIRGGNISPTLNLTLNYDATLDRVGESLLLKSFALEGTQNQQPLLKAALGSPMTIAFGDSVNAPDAALDLTLENLRLEDWRGFTPELEPAGLLAAKARIISTDGGKRLRVELDQSLRDLSVKLGQDPLQVKAITFKGELTQGNIQAGLKGTLGMSGIQLAAVSGNPLEFTLDFDAARSNQVIELTRCTLKLTPTARAKNELTVTGRMDLADSQGITGQFKLVADSLDATSYYDLFAGQSQPAATSPAPTTTAPKSNEEPPAVTLPFRNFTCEADIKRFYLREIEAADFLATVLLDGSRVLVSPFQFSLNQAPIKIFADLNLGQPGYKYDLAFSADGVPVEPLANTFSPTYRGQAKGTLISRMELKGAGLTGGSLRTNLTGMADFNFTNANIQIVGPMLQPVIAGVTLALQTPELLRSPLDYVNSSLRAGDGKIEVAQFTAQSPALRLQSQGVIPLADVLNDSPLNQPVQIALAAEYASKLGLSSASTNENYVALPTFVSLVGTLGKPDKKIEMKALAGTAVSTLIKSLDADTAGKINEAVSAIGGLLGNRPAPTNATPQAAGTNAPATNPPTKSDLLDALRKLAK